MERRSKGTGSVTKSKQEAHKAKPWRANITMDNGKPRTWFFKTRKEAEAHLSKVKKDENTFKSLIYDGVTFNAYSAIYLERKESSMKDGSFRTLKDNVKRVCDFIGERKLSQIDSDVVQQMIDDLDKKGYSKSIMDKSKYVVDAVLKMAAAKKIIPYYPTLDIVIPEKRILAEDRNAKDNWLRENEMAQYEIECKKTYIPKTTKKNPGKEQLIHTSAYRFLLLLHTGIRLGEALALTWDDYIEASKTLVIEKNISYVNRKKIVQTPKTPSGNRVIILNKQALHDIEVLRAQFNEQSEEIAVRREKELEICKKTLSGIELKVKEKDIKTKYAAILREHKYICGSVNFPYGSGGTSGTGEAHRKICKAIGLTHNVTVHGLRHTYVTHYYLHHKNDPDFDLATFSKSIGHASIRTTMEIYAHLDMTENRYTVRSVSDLKDF